MNWFRTPRYLPGLFLLALAACGPEREPARDGTKTLRVVVTSPPPNANPEEKPQAKEKEAVTPPPPVKQAEQYTAERPKGVSFWAPGQFGTDIQKFPRGQLPAITVPTYLNLTNSDVTDDDLKEVAALPNIVELNLRKTKVTAAGLKHLAKLDQLRRLSLAETSVGDAGLTELAGLTRLEYLNLESTPIRGEGFRHLAGLKNLKRIYLGYLGDSVADRYLPELAKSGLLHTLNGVSSDDEVSSLRIFLFESPAAGIKALAGLKNLKTLEISSPVNLASDALRDAMKELVALKNLTTLSLFNAPVTDDVLRHVAKLTKLEQLYLRGTILRYFNVGLLAPLVHLKDLELPYGCLLDRLPPFKNLTKLTYWGGMGASAVPALLRLPNLTTLDVAEVLRPDNSGPDLRTLAPLRKLTLIHSRVRWPLTNGELAGLREARLLHAFPGAKGPDPATRPRTEEEVTEFSLRDTAITDKALSELAGLHKLISLDLSATGLSDAGLKTLAGWRKLKSLDVSQTGVTAAGVAELRMALPDCRIVHKPR